MTLTRMALEQRGFTGFVPFSDVPITSIPSAGGIYVVVHPAGPTPEFSVSSSAGWRKQRNPAVGVELLAEKWVTGAEILYIGKAEIGIAGAHGLQGRLTQYARHGTGGTSHHGGRYIWQLRDLSILLVGWKTSQQPRDAEKELLAEFEDLYGALPFANLRH